MEYFNYLRRYRGAKHLTQRQVARRMGLKDASLISRWESGSRLPDLENAFKLAVIYGVMVDALFIDLRRSMMQRPGVPVDRGEETFLSSKSSPYV